uniref:Uncharacterized protein n=1 Tax=Manihot esculenta TaxID=3983 RepID=A0A2C9UZI4_MANES
MPRNPKLDIQKHTNRSITSKTSQPSSGIKRKQCNKQGYNFFPCNEDLTMLANQMLRLLFWAHV